MPACHAGGRRFEPVRHRSLRDVPYGVSFFCFPKSFYDRPIFPLISLLLLFVQCTVDFQFPQFQRCWSRSRSETAPSIPSCLNHDVFWLLLYIPKYMFDVFAATDSQTKCKIIVLTKDFFILILHIINITMKKTKLLLLVAASVLLINGKQSSHDSMTEYVGVWDFTAVVRTFEMVESIPLIDSLIIRWGFKRSIRWNNVNLHWPRDS